MRGVGGREAAGSAAAQTDEQIEAYVRQHADTVYHPVGTCRMGPAAQAASGGSVVDAQLRVHGMEGLRVVDASIMPIVASGNLNVPTIMMAEKLADAIRGRAPLPPSAAPAWLHPAWQTQQR